MVVRKNIDKKFALISVYRKNKLDFLCKNLKKHKYKFISTGKTAKKIKDLGYKCIDLSKIINFKEILDGRVKSIDQKIYGSILYIRDKNTHKNQFKKLKFPEIDLVIVDLYPFDKISKNKKNSNIIEMIDVGGPGLLRAGGKNFKFITVVSNINSYKILIKNLNKNNGKTDLDFRKNMAAQTFDYLSKYDSKIYKWLKKDQLEKNKFKLRYGENPNQVAYIKDSEWQKIKKLQLSGKELSYNNIIDIDSGYKCLLEFSEPTCLILKHTNPCGAASSKKIESAFAKAMQCDKKSAFGGIVLFNRTIKKDLAEELAKNFFEIIISTKFEKNSLDILRKRKNLILMELQKSKIEKKEHKSTIFGNLYQNTNLNKINKSFINQVSYEAAKKSQVQDLIFSLKIAKHLKSNAIVLSNNKQTIGIGQGQTNRVDALKIAMMKMKTNFKKTSFVCASDGFFPFVDSIKILNRFGCKVLAQPSGSVNDINIIKYAVEKKIALYFTKYRLFKH